MAANDEIMRLDMVEKEQMEEILNAPVLPEAAVADNGKVLTVVNGAWDKADPSGGSELPEVTSGDKDKYLHTNSSTGDLEWAAASGGGVLNVNVVYGDESIYLDKTYAQIKAAFDSGVTVIVAKDDSWDDPESGYELYTKGIVNCVEDNFGVGTTEYHMVTISTIGTFVADSVNDNPYMSD